MVEVTQADRDAAADFLDAWEPGPEMTVVKLARTFARHRETERKAIVSFLNLCGGEFANKYADWIEDGEHLK